MNTMKYVYTVLVMLFLSAIVIFMVQNTRNSGGKAQRIACHKKSVVFEKIYDDTLIEKVQNALHSGEYSFTSSVQRSVHMKSRLFKYVDLKEVDKLVKKTITKHHLLTSKSEDKVAMDYYIYENDKSDPGKKTAKSKLYAGYLHFTFSIRGKKVYAVQVDFMDLEGKDIDKSVQCAIRSVMTLQ